MAREEQEAMQQSTEKQREAKPIRNSITVMFHGKQVFFGESGSSRARFSTGRSLFDALTGMFLKSFATLSLPSQPKLNAAESNCCYQTRTRVLQHTEIYSAEVPEARSILTVSAVNPIRRGTKAVASIKSKTNEHCRGGAAQSLKE